MKWLIASLCVVAVAALPAEARANAENETSQAEVQQLSSPPKPWLRLELDDDGFQTIPTFAGLRRAGSYDPRADYPLRSRPGLSRGAKIGLGVGMSVLVLGVVFVAVGATATRNIEFGQ